MDAINIAGDSRNVILDHCSATWSIDEALSPSGALSDVTVQWCLIAEGLNKSHHSKGAHGYGSLARAVGRLTLHHLQSIPTSHPDLRLTQFVPADDATRSALARR